MTQNEVLAEFRDAGALLEGHFILSSGLRSPVFLQKMFIFQDPVRTERLCRALAAKIEALRPVDYVVSPAVGGIVPGYETARHLGAKAIFVERENGAVRPAARLRHSGGRARRHGRGHRHDRPVVARMPGSHAPTSRDDPRSGLPHRPLGRQGGSRRAAGQSLSPSTFRPIAPDHAAAGTGRHPGGQARQPQPQIIIAVYFYTGLTALGLTT